MKFAKGGYIPDPPDDSARQPALEPGEKIIRPDGSIWRVNEDGETIELIRGPNK